MKSDFRKYSEMLSTLVCDTNVENTNTYTPKVQSTVRPDEKLTYNEIHNHINKQLKYK